MSALADGHVDRAKGIASKVIEWIEWAVSYKNQCKETGTPYRGAVVFIPKSIPLRYDQAEQLKSYGIIICRDPKQYGALSSKSKF